MLQTVKSEAEKDCFFTLVRKFADTTDPAERQRLKQELARMTFGE
jgi:hypothetical protein